MWNPLAKIKDKLTGAPKPAGPAAEAAAAAGGVPDLKELEKQGLLGKFLRHWKNPAFLQQMKAVAARMQADGVDVKDKAAVAAWLEKHKAELEAGTLSAPPSAPAGKPFVKAGPDTGRNDPCPCGSGKKYKKCCESKGS